VRALLSRDRAPERCTTVSSQPSTRLAPDDLPPAALRQQIADATRVSVRFERGTKWQRTRLLCDCVLCAYAGAIVTSVFSKKEYAVSAGALSVCIAKPNEWLCLEARMPAIGPAQYHAWFTATHPGGRVEVADVCADHYPAEVDHRALAWSGGKRPSYMWDWADRLLPDIRFAVDTAAIDQARAWYSHHLDLVHGIVQHAFHLVRAGWGVA